MKKVPVIVALVGLVLVVISLVGKYHGIPGYFMGVRTMNILSYANTVLLLAIFLKLIEKK
jgi:hypothetical protein